VGGDAAPLTWGRLGVALGLRPGLWATVARQAGALRARGALAPSPEWLRFRVVTQYGDAGHRADPDDVIAWLEWCKAVRRCTQ
jgi:hypothetical protein